MKQYKILLGLFASVGMFVSAASAIPYCSTTEQVNCAKYGIEGKDCSQMDNAAPGTQCIDVSERGMEVVRAFEAHGGGAGQQTCPAGFRPSEDKCSVEERRRGCKDMRLPNGLGCVNR